MSTPVNQPGQVPQEEGFQDDLFGGDPKQTAMNQILEQMAQEQYGKKLGALTTDEFQPLLDFMKQNAPKIKQMLEQALVGGVPQTGRSIGGAVFAGAQKGVNTFKGALDKVIR